MSNGTDSKRAGGRTRLAGMQANMAEHKELNGSAQQIKKMETIHHGAFEHDIFVFGSNAAMNCM